MINNNPKEWSRVLLWFGKSDTVRKLFPYILLAALYAAGIAYLEIEVWKLNEKSFVRNISMMHTLLGFVISFLLVFRTNTAYERWWEARKLWGALVNSSRNMAMKINAILPAEHPSRTLFRSIIPTYASVLKNHLRSEAARITLFDDLPPELQNELDVQKHLPNQIVLLMHRNVHALLRSGAITGQQLIALSVEISAFTDICGACERIKNTPIPYSYSAFIKKFVVVYILTLPFGYVFNLGYYVVPMVAFIFYVLASLELIAEEIEDPFDGDDNDLPLDKIVHNIRTHIHELV